VRDIIGIYGAHGVEAHKNEISCMTVIFALFYIRHISIKIRLVFYPQPQMIVRKVKRICRESPMKHRKLITLHIIETLIKKKKNRKPFQNVLI
jgi:hypothetical protein